MCEEDAREIADVTLMKSFQSMIHLYLRPRSRYWFLGTPLIGAPLRPDPNLLACEGCADEANKVSKPSDEPLDIKHAYAGFSYHILWSC